MPLRRSSSSAQGAPQIIPPLETAFEIHESISQMSERQLLLMCCCPELNKLSERYAQEVGGVFLHADTPDNHREKLRRFGIESGSGKLIAADMESGPGAIQGTPSFPSFSGLVATGEPAIAFQAGKSVALAAHEVGINWTLAPCVDIVRDFDSPMASIRSGGSNHLAILQTALAFMRGVQEHGLLATAKHFPGDGGSSLDQHLTTPAIDMSLEEWEQAEGQIYRKLINEGICAIMPGHISFPAVDPTDDFLPLPPPATLSRKLLQELLRERLGFRGLVISDAMSMGGVTGFENYYRASARFLEAGGDMLLFPDISERFIEKVLDCISEGLLSRERLEQAAANVWRTSQYVIAQKNAQADGSDVSGFIADAARKASTQAVVKVRDREERLPLNPDRNLRILHLILRVDPSESAALYDHYDQQLSRYGTVTRWEDPGCDALFTAMDKREFDLVICQVDCPVRYGTNVVRLHGPVARNMMKGWMKLGVPVVFIAQKHPFFHHEYEAAADIVINAHCGGENASDKILRLIFGFPQNQE